MARAGKESVHISWTLPVVVNISTHCVWMHSIGCYKRQMRAGIWIVVLMSTDWTCPSLKSVTTIPDGTGPNEGGQPLYMQN